MAAAHTGMNADPSAKCATCHPVAADAFATSQHSQLMGYRQVIAARAGVAELTPGLEAMFEQNCNTCHATCGQCHISRPNTVAKGFVRGHEFVRRPSMTENCTACHCSRVGQEFRGQHEGIPADLHYNMGMQCVACHAAEEMHGHGDQGSNRYEVASLHSAKTVTRRSKKIHITARTVTAYRVRSATASTTRTAIPVTWAKA